MPIYLLLIFEGSIRKWLLPELASYIFFIRDPFLVYAYLLAFHHRLWPRGQAFLWIVVAMAGVGLLVGAASAFSSAAGPNAAVIAIYGWRNYFLYAPLAFLVGAQFSIEDVRRLCRWTLLLAAPIGVLVAAQFAASPRAAINVGTATNTALQFLGLGLDAAHVRPMGTFSSVAGQTQFVASAFAILLGALITPARRRFIPWWLLALGAGGVATCVALGGNRSALLSCVVIAVAGMGLCVIGRSAAVKARALVLPAFLAIAFAALFPALFPEGFDTFTHRWETAAANESRIGGVVGRALYSFHDFTDLIDGAPTFGYGLGLGGNAALTLKITGAGSSVPYAESDWARHIVDLGPFLGLGYIALRIALFLWLGTIVLRAIRRDAGPLPLLLYAYVALVLVNGQITGQGAINGYAWLFTGLTLAAAAARPASTYRERQGRSARL
jgi:hypothetical protein